MVNYDFFITSNYLSQKYWKEFFTDFKEVLYYSICNYFTSDNGIVNPISWIGKLLSIVQMFIGVTFMGAWTATLLKKFMK